MLKDFIDTLLKNGLLKERVNNKIKKLGENHKNEINSLLVDLKEYGVTISNLTKEIKSLHDTVEEVTCAYNDQTSKFNNYIEQTIQFNCQIFYKIQLLDKYLSNSEMPNNKEKLLEQLKKM